MAVRKDIMLAQTLDLRRLEHWPRPFIAQPKVEGLRNRAIIKETHQGYTCQMFTSSAASVVSVPHIGPQLIDQLKGYLIPGQDLEIDGELYIHGVPFSGSDNSVSRIGRRTVNLHPLYETMEYHIFDIINSSVQIDRTSRLLKMSKSFHESIKYVAYTLLKDPNDVAQFLTDCMAEGYEGIILRDPQSFYQRKRVPSLMKFKPREQDTYRIIGVVEEVSIHGRPKGTLGAFICDKDGQQFRVGSGPALTKPGRQEFWDYQNLIANGAHYAVIKYQYLTPGRGVPYPPIVVEVIPESEVKDED